jgi:hypothetical protein
MEGVTSPELHWYWLTGGIMDLMNTGKEEAVLHINISGPSNGEEERKYTPTESELLHPYWSFTSTL